MDRQKTPAKTMPSLDTALVDVPFSSIAKAWVYKDSHRDRHLTTSNEIVEYNCRSRRPVFGVIEYPVIKEHQRRWLGGAVPAPRKATLISISNTARFGHKAEQRPR